ncbi:Linear amide C-N hydrolase, choloylglycine hydrolase family [Pirellulimonas nuda]|uniref:Linear amide C-N hydrolase, choloylglycine hydrolase family n=1 Tax=Pirellulimonas nuda TaxID=2528009 RepID=A0A518DJS2_9BACT|nr:linear amide C-N hydrolase [Pirellulimonas nuda]QDU91721.1 Linear amide C-N hydrolase, choloylglycine hydrolase family [Pirellulimonas nuda]
MHTLRGLVLAPFVLLVSALADRPAPACTTFSLHCGDAAFFGRNYDWHIETATVLVNPRGLAKRAFVFDRPAEWVSRYGSVTFNQYGREFPCDGMNEAGLVVAVMWLPETRYPNPDDRPAVTAAQWVQYQLDTASTVDEVLKSDRRVRVSGFGGVQVHYLVADAQGGCAAIEFLNGRRVVHTGAEMTRTLSNTPYAEAAARLSARRDAGPSSDRSSLARFAAAAGAVRACNASSAAPSVEGVFDTLARVAQGDFTKWQIVYAQSERVVYFRTDSAPGIKSLDLRTLDFTPADSIVGVSISTEQAGDAVGRLSRYSADDNRLQIDESFDQTFFLKPLPATLRELLIAYPQSIHPAPAKSNPRPGTTRPSAGTARQAE